MSVSLPNGSILSIGSTFGAAKTMSVLSNAAQAVATLEASHGVVANDIVLITSGWSQLNGRVVRAESVSTNDVTFDDIDTSSTTDYPAASGTGSVKEVTAWTQIQQILKAQFSGGDPNFTDYAFLEDAFRRQLFTQNTPESLQLELADDPTLSHYAVLRAAAKARTNYPLRLQLSNGGVIYYCATVNFNENPTLSVNEVMAVKATFSFQAQLTRYAS